MPDYIPLATTPQAILPRFPEAPDIASKEWVMAAILNAQSVAGQGSLSGNGIPSNSTGAAGQFYTDLNTGNVWYYLNTGWTKLITA